MIPKQDSRTANLADDKAEEIQQNNNEGDMEESSDSTTTLSSELEKAKRKCLIHGDCSHKDS